MARNIEQMKRLPMDTKMVDEIRRSRSMMAEQGSGWLQDPWGGPSGYVSFGRMPMEERVTYAAVLEGFGTLEEISGATGLEEVEVERALGSLRKQGMVRDVEVEREKDVF